jgi:HAE1 family hydrophobic/amphiphilic exporter-1
MVVCTDFNKFGKQYRVMIQAKPEDRANLESINIYVMNNSGQKWR